MKVHNSVKIDLSREELEAVSIVYNMLYNIHDNEEGALNDCLCGVSVEDVRTTLAEIWELSGHDIDRL